MVDRISASESGYNREEEHFRRLNQELIEKRRAAREREKAEREAAGEKGEHWLRCPKCGGQMEEIELDGVEVDKCGSCQGIFFDAGELEMLLSAKQPESFLGRLGRWMHGEG